MKRWKHMSNKGYSLVELVIVIAIIAILSAMSLITWRSVDSANYKKAVSTLESEMSTLRTATMAQDSSMAMKIYLGTDGRYYVVRGYYDDATGFAEPAAGSALAKLSYYSYQGTSNPVCITKKGYINFNGVKIEEEGVIIQFNKSDGSVKQLVPSGSSEAVDVFSVYRKNGELVANVRLKKTTGLSTKTYTTD